MTTATGRSTTAPFEDLATVLRGDLIMPGDPGYDEARAVYNAMIDKRPAAIARCRDAADVIACVRFAREHDVEIAVRGGGHNAAGLGVCGRCPGHRPVADAQHHRQPREPHRPRRRRMHLGRRRSRDRRVRHGHAVGLPRLHRRRRPDARRRHRLPVPAFRPDRRQPALRRRRARRRHASSPPARRSHSDLFWALRGGGGNFGVVTSFTFRCHDIGDGGTIIGGPVLYDLADTAEVMRWYRELLPRCRRS